MYHFQQELSENTFVGEIEVITTCQCVTCQSKYQANFFTIGTVLDDKLIDFKKPDIECPNCHSHYIKWESKIEITQ